MRDSRETGLHWLCVRLEGNRASTAMCLRGKRDAAGPSYTPSMLDTDMVTCGQVEGYRGTATKLRTVGVGQPAARGRALAECLDAELVPCRRAFLEAKTEDG